MRVPVRAPLLALLLGCGCHVLPAAAAQTGEGWTSSSSPAFDFRANGSALPMYGLFVPCLLIFLYGVYRQLRSLGIETGGATSEGRSRSILQGLVRLLDLGLLQRRLFRRRHAAWMHLPLSLGFLVLALGSLTIMLDSYVLRALGSMLSRGVGYAAFQATLEVFGLALIAGIGLAIFRRVWVRPAHTKLGDTHCSFSACFSPWVCPVSCWRG